MTAYLLALGHTRIGFIIGDRAYAASEQRLKGYKRAFKKAGLETHLELIAQGSFDFSSGASAAKRLLGIAEPPTAIFASNDDMAAGVLATAHRMGISVPSNLSVAGFDDTPFASVVWPALTTIRQPVRELAEAATDLLLALPSSSQHRRIKHELVVRDSTSQHPAGFDKASAVV